MPLIAAVILDTFGFRLLSRPMNSPRIVSTRIQSPGDGTTLPFFEAYFSNFIKGTEFCRRGGGRHCFREPHPESACPPLQTIHAEQSFRDAVRPAEAVLQRIFAAAAWSMGRDNVVLLEDSPATVKKI